MTQAATLRSGAQAKQSANPIRRVVTMLEMMKNKVEAEGKKMEELYDKYMCYCATAEQTLGKSIADAEEKIPQLESDIKEAIEEEKTLGSDLEKHETDRTQAKEDIAKATAIRNKEAKAFAAESGDTSSNIAALGKAIPAIEKGMAGSFLQTGNAAVLRRLSISADLSSVDRDVLSAFLSAGAGEVEKYQYAPASGEILGILKQMKDEMEKDLEEITSEEDGKKADFEELVAAKKKQIESATVAIEEKTARKGELMVEIATMKNDLEDTVEGLAEDKKFLADLGKNCELKKKEWAMYQKMMAQELIAIAETIKILNDDDALDLFKKTLPSSASFLQIQTSAADVRRKALGLLRDSRGKGGAQSTQLDLVMLALRGKKVGMEKVIKMIDDMVVLLGKEQVEDDNKKEYCETEFDKADDTKKELERDISDFEKAITEETDMINSISDEIAALQDGIEALDKSVAEATEQRKKENSEFTTNLAANNAAKELIEFAKNRLAKFYNPKMYKPPPKRELSEEERITLNMGGTLAPTAAPGGIAGTGVGLVQSEGADTEAPPPPPAADMSYKKKGEESGGVTAMMDNLIADLDKEILEMEMEEKDAQEDYENTMGDAAAKRAEDSKAITDKESAKAELEESLHANKDAKLASEGELMDTKEIIANLHKECDWLLSKYDERKAARTNEIEALKKAKDVLKGADYSLLQVGGKQKRLHR